MHSPTDTDCPCFQQFPPNVVLSCGLWICIKTGQGIPPRNPTRTARTLHIPQWRNARISHRKTEKIRPQRPVCRTENAGFAPGYPKKHRPERISTIRRDGIRRFTTETGRKRSRKIPVVPVSSGFPQFPALYCSCCWIEGIKRQTDGLIARARGKTDRKGRTTFPDATRRTEERRRKNVAVPESPARTHIY